MTSLIVVQRPTATVVFPLSLHDALPIFRGTAAMPASRPSSSLPPRPVTVPAQTASGSFSEKEKLFAETDRKSTRLNSSHVKNSYAVFCLKKKRRHYVARSGARALVRSGV